MKRNTYCRISVESFILSHRPWANSRCKLTTTRVFFFPSCIGNKDVMQKFLRRKITDFVVVDILPRSIGIEDSSGTITNIFKRNQTVPRKTVRWFSTEENDQTSILIRIFEGQNDLLGEYLLSGIRALPAGTALITVTFSIDPSGILYVQAHDPCAKPDTILVTKK